MLSAFKNFAVTMLIALLIFGFGAYFASMFVTNTMNSILSTEKEQLGHIIENNESPEQNQGDEPNTPIDPDELIEGESFTLLLVITDYRPDLYGDYMPTGVQLSDNKDDQKANKGDKYDSLGYLSSDYRDTRASSIVLICADKESKQYTYTYFSPESRMNTPAGYHTLGEAYSFYGEDVLAEHIHALTGIMPEYRMTINGYNLDELQSFFGTVTVNLSRDIYFDGSAYTTEYEHTRRAVDEEGEPYLEHIPNTFILGAGVVELDEENAYILSSLAERSVADINMKESYTVEAVKQCLSTLGAMEEEELRILISMLTLNEADWITIEPAGDETSAADTDSEEVEVPPSEDNPWWSVESGVAPAETEVETLPAETEAASEETTEETGEPEETVILFEPETPILETTFTASELERIGGVVRAFSMFEQVTVSYPGKYIAATEDHGAYFDMNIKSGLNRFFAIRKQLNESDSK